MNAGRYDIAVIGAGVIGTTTALYLAERGLSVALVDRKGISSETSAGNAGAFAFSDILPLASPGIMLKAPFWLMDPTGPLSVPPAYLPTIAPWLWRFFKAGSRKNYERSISAQAALMRVAEAETEQLLERTGLKHMIVARGALHLYDTERSFNAAARGWDRRTEYGISHRHLDRAGIDAIQPGTAQTFRHGTHVASWSNVADPKAYVVALGDRAVSLGVQMDVADIERIAVEDAGVRLSFTDGRSLLAAQVVIAAGAWSHRLAALIGDRIPLETERGYNTTLPKSALDLNCQIIFDDHGFVVSPLGQAVRVGGAVELAGLDRPPNFQRSKTMLAKAARFLPELNTAGGTEWMGFRPSLPDSLPAIGRSHRVPRVIHAFGHGHLGLTQSAATAKLVADIALDRDTEIPLKPYSPHRF